MPTSVPGRAAASVGSNRSSDCVSNPGGGLQSCRRSGHSASSQVERSTNDIIAAVERDLEAARYEVSIAARRPELVDPAKRHVARELDALECCPGTRHDLRVDQRHDGVIRPGKGSRRLSQTMQPVDACPAGDADHINRSIRPSLAVVAKKSASAQSSSPELRLKAG
jgi:hypothetical protein